MTTKDQTAHITDQQEDEADFGETIYANNYDSPIKGGQWIDKNVQKQLDEEVKRETFGGDDDQTMMGTQINWGKNISIPVEAHNSFGKSMKMPQD